MVVQIRDLASSPKLQPSYKSIILQYYPTNLHSSIWRIDSLYLVRSSDVVFLLQNCSRLLRSSSTIVIQPVCDPERVNKTPPPSFYNLQHWLPWSSCLLLDNTDIRGLILTLSTIFFYKFFHCHLCMEGHLKLRLQSFNIWVVLFSLNSKYFNLS